MVSFNEMHRSCNEFQATFSLTVCYCSTVEAQLIVPDWGDKIDYDMGCRSRLYSPI